MSEQINQTIMKEKHSKILKSYMPVIQTDSMQNLKESNVRTEICNRTPVKPNYKSNYGDVWFMANLTNFI
jgi:hypothetical protein